MRSRAAPRGAILMMALALLTLLALLVGLLARSAILTHEKSRSMALADASAKSVATWYAQILNYDAYSNRAIAANEIMMAQAVTLSAWTHYVHTLAGNAGAVAALIPSIQPMAAWIQEAAGISHQMAKAGAMVEIPVRSAYTRALQGSQHIMHASATPFAAQAMVNEVIWTADSRFFGQLIPSSDISAFHRFSKAHDGDQREPLADLIRRSQDQFSRQRAFDQRLYLAPTVGCIPRSIEQAFGKLLRRGGTWLSDGYDNWESLDTLSLHTWRRRSRWNPSCSGLGETQPFGWGAADAEPLSGSGGLSQATSSAANPSATAQARSSTVAIPGYLGLAGFRELASSGIEDRKSAHIRVPVLIRLPAEKLPSTTWFAPRLTQKNEFMLRTKLWSLGVGEAFFHRPADTMNDPTTRDFANLFMPFWMSRLASPTAADRAVALMLAKGERP